MAQVTPTSHAHASALHARQFSSLRVRLALTLALSVAVTGVGASWLALRIARQSLAEELRGIATRAAERAAAGVEGLPAGVEPPQVSSVLRTLDSAFGEVESIALVARDGDRALLLATSGSPPSDIGLALALRAIAEQRPVTLDTADTIRVARPVQRQGAAPAAVLVRSNLAAMYRLQQRALSAIAGFAIITIIGLVVLVDVLATRLIYEPVQRLRETIARVSAGDLSARAPVARRDEIGEVSEGLNEMLARLEHFNEAMLARVREATDEVQRGNEQLVESFRRAIGLREQLASAEQLASVGQTAANVAHQVGTPLNLISGYVQLLREELGPDSPHAPRLAIIEEQIGKVTTTVRTLLDRSRRLGRKTRRSAGALVARVVEVMLPNLAAARVSHHLELPADDLPILVDATNLELSLLNLLTNAVDAMPEGGTLQVRVGRGDAGRVTIAISDTGHGIPDELLPHIFEPWVSTKKPGRGTGLGLAIARDVVSAHGGSISVTSTVGGGTTFTIDLPSAPVHSTGRAAS